MLLKLNLRSLTAPHSEQEILRFQDHSALCRTFGILAPPIRRQELWQSKCTHSFKSLSERYRPRLWITKREPTPNPPESTTFLVLPCPEDLPLQRQSIQGRATCAELRVMCWASGTPSPATFQVAVFIIKDPRFLQDRATSIRGCAAYSDVRVFSLCLCLKIISGPLASLSETCVSWRNPGQRHIMGWGVEGTKLSLWLQETASRVPGDQASVPPPWTPTRGLELQRRRAPFKLERGGTLGPERGKSKHDTEVKAWTARNLTVRVSP